MHSVSARIHHRIKLRNTHVGQGVFAARPFLRDEIIGRIEGRIVSDGTHDPQYSIDLGDHRVLEPKSPFRFLNHCCAPNCEIVYDDGMFDMYEDRVLYVQTRRDVRRGEQLTIDYGWPIEAAIPCFCGHEHCRGWIVAEHKLSELLALKANP